MLRIVGIGAIIVMDKITAMKDGTMPTPQLTRKQVKAWVWKLKEPPAVKILLLALADRLSDDGLAWPKLETLAEDCCISRATVIRLLEKMIKQGYLSKVAWTRKGSQAQTSNRYRFVHPSLTGFQNETLTELQNDTLPTTTELQNATGQSIKMQPPELQNDTPRVFPQRVFPQDESLGTDSSPSPSLIATETTTRAPRQKRASKQVTTEPTTAREKGLAILADAEFMVDIATDFPDRNIPYEGKKWLEYITEKPPKGNYKNSLRNWLEKSRQFERGSIARVPATYQNGTGKKPPLGDFSNGDQEPQYLRAKIVGLSDAEDAIQLAPVQGGRTR